MSTPENEIVNRQSAPLGVLARLWWMMLGNVLLVFSLLFLFRKQGGFLHPADAVFWATVAALVLVRYLDIRFLDGQTATGEPTTVAHWVRYAVLLVSIATVLWGLAHVVSHTSVGAS